MATLASDLSRLASLSSTVVTYQNKITAIQKEIASKNTQIAEAKLAGSSTETLEQELKVLQAKVEGATFLLEQSKATLKAAQADLSKVKTKTTENLGNTSPTDNTASDKPHKYNPPLAKNATLSDRGPQFNQDNAGSTRKLDVVTNVSKYWQGNNVGKGTIQQSKKFPYSFDVSTNTKLVSAGLNLFGFRFLYNPTEVFMNWGVSTEIDAAKFVGGELMLNPVTDAASASSINFSVILNRIPDMSLVNENGTLNASNAYTSKSGTISAEHAKGIYEKGTMYDLEFLFKTVNGFNAEFVSSLNLTSADPGWLNSFPVELHLGKSLRYLVRVTNLEVNHKIFDHRMVPTFTVVNMVCKRLPDWDSAYKASGAGAQSNQGGFR